MPASSTTTPPTTFPGTTAENVGADAPGEPSTADLAHDLRLACMRVARRVRYDAGNTIAPHLFSVLATLASTPRTVGELAAMEQVSAPSMSRAVARLCEEGLVERLGDERDGRVVRLELTPLGVERVTTEREHRDRWFTERLAGLDPADRALLRRAAGLLEELAAR